MSFPLLQVINLKVELIRPESSKSLLQEVNFELRSQELLAVIGESGGGKSLLIKALLKLLPPHFKVSGQIIYTDGNEQPVDLNHLSEKEINVYRRRKIGVLFQEPLSGLNPVLSCGTQLRDAVAFAREVSFAEAHEIALNLFATVGLLEPAAIYCTYPHQLSGGMAQRVALALALAGQPRLLLIDEPTSALDCIARREFMDLIQNLRQTQDLTVFMVTHDFANIAQIAAKILVLYAGLPVEYGDADRLWRQPHHPYTHLLFTTYQTLQKGETVAPSSPKLSDSASSSNGCSFAPRCPVVQDHCYPNFPSYQLLPDGTRLYCHFPLSP